jgi:homoserine dehydrogenase
MSTAKLLPKTVSVAVVGVGLVGSEFVRQLQALPLPNPFRLVSLSSSKTTVFDPNGIPPSADWRALLRASLPSSPAPSATDLPRTLAPLVRSDNDVVLVDNTAAPSVAETYPALLRAGVHVVTPNKKAFSGAQTLYDQIVAASRESGAKFLHEATVGAGLPVLSTLKDLVATGDKVNAFFLARSLFLLSPGRTRSFVIALLRARALHISFTAQQCSCSSGAGQICPFSIPYSFPFNPVLI